MTADRRQKLLELVRSQGFSSLPALADALDVSESTIRRDLAHLEKEGAAKRTHGGAFYTGASPQLAHFRQRQAAQWDKKRAIAELAAKTLEHADSVLLDGGSTTYELARLLVERPLQVVTNSLPVANLFSPQPNIDLIMVGGYVHSSSGVIHGAYADEMLKSLGVRAAVISAAGVSDGGLYNSSHMLATTQLAMASAADEVIAVVDSTKFGRQSLASICQLSSISRLITDDGLTDEWRDKIESAGAEVLVAAAEQPSQAVADSSE
ncbi:MAG: DeoR/GlpR family DNA-binding transcription regulator [Planctomycetota bacterium]